MWSQQSRLGEKCASGSECAEWMNAGHDLSGPESHSPPVLLSPDGCSLYVKQTLPFHSAAPIVPLCHDWEARLCIPQCSPNSHKMTTGFFFIEVRAKDSHHMRETYHTAKNRLDYGEDKDSWLKTKGWFIQSSVLLEGGGGFSWLC